MPSKLKPEVSPAWEESILDVNVPYNPLLVFNTQVKPNCAVFEGGGVKGIAYVGALKELHGRGMLADLEHVAGSSAGGITAFLLGIGHSPQEIEDIMENKINFTDFVNEKDKKWWDPAGLANKFSSLHSLISKDTHGLVSGDRYTALIESLLVEQIKKKFQDKFLGQYQTVFKTFFSNFEKSQARREAESDPRYKKMMDPIAKAQLLEELIFEKLAKNMRFSHFKEVRHRYPELGFIDMKFTGTNITQRDGVTFGSGGQGREKDFRVVDAVRITGSFPGMFAAVPVRDPDTGKVDLYVDGGLCNNFPSTIFDHEDYLPDGVKATKNLANPGMIGFLVDSKDEMDSKIWHKSIEEQGKSSSFLAYLSDLVSGMQINTEAIEKHDTRIIQIYDTGVSTLKFDVTKEETSRLIKSGKQAASQWLQNYHEGAFFDFDHHIDLHSKYAGLTPLQYNECAAMLFSVYAKIERGLHMIVSNPKIDRIETLLGQCAEGESMSKLVSEKNLKRLLLKIAQHPNLDRERNELRRLFLNDPYLYLQIDLMNKSRARLSYIKEEVNAICDYYPLKAINHTGQQILNGRKNNITKIIRGLEKRKFLKKKKPLEQEKAVLESNLDRQEVEKKGFVRDLQGALKQGLYFDCVELASKCKSNLKKLEEIIRINGKIMKLYRARKKSLERDLAFLPHKIEALKAIQAYNIEYRIDRERIESQFPNNPQERIKLLIPLERANKQNIDRIRNTIYDIRREQDNLPKLSRQVRNKLKEELHLIHSRTDKTVAIGAKIVLLERAFISKKEAVKKVDKQISSLEVENEQAITKKYIFDRQIRMYTVASKDDNIQKMRKLIDLNSKLTEYIKKESNFVTNSIEYFCTKILKTKKFPFRGKAAYIYSAREHQRKIQDILESMQKSWSTKDIDQLEKHFNIYKNGLAGDLKSYKSIFSGDSYKELMAILKDYEASNKFIDNSDLEYMEHTNFDIQ